MVHIRRNPDSEQRGTHDPTPASELRTNPRMVRSVATARGLVVATARDLAVEFAREECSSGSRHSRGRRYHTPLENQSNPVGSNRGQSRRSLGKCLAAGRIYPSNQHPQRWVAVVKAVVVAGAGGVVGFQAAAQVAVAMGYTPPQGTSPGRSH